MSFLLGRDGQLSIVRVGTVVAVVGVLLVIGAAVAFYLDQASHQVPLDVAVYPGAESLGEPAPTGTNRTLYFIVRDTPPEEVVQYYDQILEDQYKDTGESCQRYPNEVDNYTNSEGRNDVVPYEFICLFDRSGFYATQFTKVTIQPGLFDSDSRVNQLGNTLIEYQQRWQS